MVAAIRVAILEDHQSIIDGYLFRLSNSPDIKIVATAHWGEDLQPMLENHIIDVLILDLNIPTSAEKHTLFPIIHSLPTILSDHPNMNVLVISMITSPPLLEALEEAGVNGYISKDDTASIQQLGKIITMIANGGMYFNQGISRGNRKKQTDIHLTPRQMEILSLCASHPDDSSQMLAKRSGVSSSTIRNLLSMTYARLGVRTRAAAIARAQSLGLLPFQNIPILEYDE